MWLECIGMGSGCCCKEVYKHPHNNFFLLSPRKTALFNMAMLYTHSIGNQL